MLAHPIFRLALVTAVPLFIPAIAMQFTNEVAWTLSDFVIAGVLIFGTGLAYQLIARRTGTTAYRIAVGLALLGAFLLIWVNGAVGIIGSEDNPANLLYAGVLAALGIGTLIARLRPQGMVYALLVTALVHLLVPVVAFMIWRPSFDAGVLAVLALNACFALLWVGSALLFRRAAEHS